MVSIPTSTAKATKLINATIETASIGTTLPRRRTDRIADERLETIIIKPLPRKSL